MGPVADATLRSRLTLARRVLVLAYRRWRLIEAPLAELVELTPSAPARVATLDHDQLLALLIAARPHLDDAILGAVWIGWRRANILGADNARKGRDIPGLTWDRVIFPVRQEGRLIKPGRIWYPREHSKTAKPQVSPMSDRVEQLLLARWHVRDGPLVFHDGTGQPFRDIRKAWWSALHQAGLPRMRWHDLRHCWASELAEAGADDRELQELGGWSNPAMVQRYSHLRISDRLMRAVNLPGRLQ